MVRTRGGESEDRCHVLARLLQVITRDSIAVPVRCEPTYTFAGVQGAEQHTAAGPLPHAAPNSLFDSNFRNGDEDPMG